LKYFVRHFFHPKNFPFNPFIGQIIFLSMQKVKVNATKHVL